MKIDSTAANELAKTGEEYRALVMGDADWIARCADDLRQLRHRDIGPLRKLPEQDFETFVSGLRFEGGGVAHGTYKPLMATFTLTEIFEVFALFGMHRDYVLRILEFKCAEPPPDTGGGGNCEFEFWSFCSSMCGIVVFPSFSSAAT